MSIDRMHTSLIPAALLLLLLGPIDVTAQQPAVDAGAAGTKSVTRGRATTVTVDNFLSGCQGSRVSAVGQIGAFDGIQWIVPAETAFGSGPKASDLFNDCSGVRLPNIGALDPESVPVAVVDADGDVVTGYLFADNYFELYVNGVLVAVDPVPFTPFNSSVVRFRVKRPYTIAVKLVDWEENLGLGSENNMGDAFHPGDGGFIASFSDGTVTGSTWKAQTFYIAPLPDSTMVIELQDGTRSSSGAPAAPACGENCFAIHYPIPAEWTLPSFDDSAWPPATLYTESSVGVDNKSAYTNFAQQFSGAGARFIWSSNIILDNVVLVRTVVGASAASAGREEATGVSTADLLRFDPVAPNPGASSFTLQFTIERSERVVAEIFDLGGVRIGRVADRWYDAGRHAIAWEGRMPDGSVIPAGVYVVRISAGSATAERRMVVIR